jgi:ABC-type sugar transport system ATPase subunit
MIDSKQDPGKHDRHPVLEARGLTKRYGAVLASNAIDLKIYPGEVMALIGDNGAGKSTLVKMLSGALEPDEGSLLLDGEPTDFSTPLDARLRGVEIVYQDLALSEILDIAGNMFLGREVVHKIPFWPASLSVLNRRAMEKQSAERLGDLAIRLPATSKRMVRELSGGQRQAVAVARGAAWATRVLLLDEPTAALGVRQSEMVLKVVRRLAQSGLAVVLITHTLPFVMECADRVVVLRRGNLVGDLPIAEATAEHLVSLIVGFDEKAASFGL